MPLRGVIFDLDGTLGDTLPVCYAAFREVLQPHLRRDFTDAEIHVLFGPTEGGIFRRLMPDDWEAGLRAYLAAYARLHARLERKIVGVESVLQDLSRQHFPAAVVTGKGPESTRISLRALGLAEYFDVVEAGSPYGPVKPEAIRRILDRWRLSPDQVAYVGDSAYDVRAARRAGVLAVAAAWAPAAPMEALRAAQPDELFEQVSDFGEWLAGRLAAEAR